MMDLDEALELVADGAVVSRPSWGECDFIHNHVVNAPNGAEVVCWRTTRLISVVDMEAEDWCVLGLLH